jgi:hypothetical protein
MPARRERVLLCPGESGRPVRIAEFPSWWDRRAFFREYGDRSVDTGNPFSVDYGVLLTGAEAHAFDRAGREAFARDPRSDRAETREAMHRWEAMLKDASWVIVDSYEWESGLE